MAQENVDIVRGLIEAWNERDGKRAIAYLSPDVEWTPAGPAAIERTVYRGHDECARGFAAVWETWDQFDFTETEIRDLDDSVLWLGHVHARGKSSSVELDQEFAHHIVVDETGKIVRAHAFLTWQEALDATGLSRRL